MPALICGEYEPLSQRWFRPRYHNGSTPDFFPSPVSNCRIGRGLNWSNNSSDCWVLGLEAAAKSSSDYVAHIEIGILSQSKSRGDFSDRRHERLVLDLRCVR